jgi:hypothetical protein
MCKHQYHNDITSYKSKTHFLKTVSIAVAVVVVIISLTLMALLIVIPSSLVSAMAPPPNIKSINAQNSTTTTAATTSTTNTNNNLKSVSNLFIAGKTYPLKYI